MQPLRIRVADATHLPQTFESDLRSALAEELKLDSDELALRLEETPRVPGADWALYEIYLHGHEIGEMIALLARELAPKLAHLAPRVAEAFVYHALYNWLRALLKGQLAKLRVTGVYPKLEVDDSQEKEAGAGS